DGPREHARVLLQVRVVLDHPAAEPLLLERAVADAAHERVLELRVPDRLRGGVQRVGQRLRLRRGNGAHRASPANEGRASSDGCWASAPGQSSSVMAISQNAIS